MTSGHSGSPPPHHGRVWPAAQRRFAPWKNGGGETATILSMPPEAGIDGFHWRISTAIIARSGPFSRFPGVARVFTVVEGGPVCLRFATHSETRAPGAPPLEFSGDLDCHADHDGAATLALNVMTRPPYHARVSHDDTAWQGTALARYVFALEPCTVFDPDLGAERDLDRHDLIETATPPDKPALRIGIFG